MGWGGGRWGDDDDEEDVRGSVSGSPLSLSDTEDSLSLGGGGQTHTELVCVCVCDDRGRQWVGGEGAPRLPSSRSECEAGGGFRKRLPEPLLDSPVQVKEGRWRGGRGGGGGN